MDTLLHKKCPIRKHCEITVVIPLFNESKIVDELIERVDASCKKTGCTFEILVVNDGSVDDTEEKLRALIDKNPTLRVINLRRNFGHMSALTAGLKLSNGDATIVLDGDLQDPPELIPELVIKWKEGANVVYGQRYKSDEKILKRFFSSIFYKIITRATEFYMPENVGTYSLIDRESLEILNKLPEKHRFFAGLRAWIGGIQVSVPYKRLKRKEGKSHVGAIGMIRLSVLAICSLSTLPLRIVAICNCIAIVAALILMVVLGLRHILILSTNGITSLIVLFIMCICTLILMSLCIIATYLAFIFDEEKQRDLYIIKEIFGKKVSAEL